jgi:hypothetical protein
MFRNNVTRSFEAARNLTHISARMASRAKPDEVGAEKTRRLKAKEDYQGDH